MGAYTITAMTDGAEELLNKLCKQYVHMGAIMDTMKNDLLGTAPIEPVPLFSGLPREFGTGFQVAHADHSEAFSPSAGGGNSGRGGFSVA